MVTIALDSFIWARGAKLRVNDWRARHEGLSHDHDDSWLARHSKKMMESTAGQTTELSKESHSMMAQSCWAHLMMAQSW